MDRKEEIIIVTLKLASQIGLSNVSMEQIAKQVGIKKPSLYNHFKSKDEIIDAMYEYLREKSKNSLSISNVDYSLLVKDKSAEEILKQSVNNYTKFCTQSDMFLFYKLIYAERAFNQKAAKIMLDETNKMILSTKNLFYALQVHEKLNIKDIDTAATSFALSIHAFLDYKLDSFFANEQFDDSLINNYISWFCNQNMR